MQVACDDILVVWKMNTEKHAGNLDKCAGMQDQQLLVVVLMVPLIMKAMSNKDLLKLLYCLGKLAFEIKE